MQKKITLLWGLPGSGKTTYAKTFVNDFRTRVLDLDGIGKNYKGDAFIDRVVDMVDYELIKGNHVVLDGLITTNAAADKLLLAIAVDQKHRDLVFEIVYWKADRAACKHNDRGRRSVNAAITIEHLPFEEPSQALLAAYHVIPERLICKEVVRKPKWQAWAEENGLSCEGNCYHFCSWSLGGIAGDCYGGSHHVHADKTPTTFQAFDGLLERLAPTLSFVQYKKLWNECVSIREICTGDYYDGSVTHANFVCNVEKLYHELEKLGVVA